MLHSKLQTRNALSSNLQIHRLASACFRPTHASCIQLLPAKPVGCQPASFTWM